MTNVIAKTILAQLGGNRFVAMTGSKDFVATENGLTFKLAKFTTVFRTSTLPLIATILIALPSTNGTPAACNMQSSPAMSGFTATCCKTFSRTKPGFTQRFEAKRSGATPAPNPKGKKMNRDEKLDFWAVIKREVFKPNDKIAKGVVVALLCAIHGYTVAELARETGIGEPYLGHLRGIGNSRLRHAFLKYKIRPFIRDCDRKPVIPVSAKLAAKRNQQTFEDAVEWLKTAKDWQNFELFCSCGPANAVFVIAWAGFESLGEIVDWVEKYKAEKTEQTPKKKAKEKKK